MLALVAAAAVAGWAMPRPGRMLDRHQAIDIVLAVLVFASAMTVPAGMAERVRALAPRLAVVALAGLVCLPSLAFGLSRLLAAGALRDGVLAVGVAPAEVASVAITGIAGGEVGAVAVLLVASTLTSVLAAGPILSLAGGHGVSSLHVLISLLLVVGAPLLAGLALRRAVSGDRAVHGFQVLSIVAVVALVWLVSAQARLSAAYAGLIGVLAALILASAGLGLLLGARLAGPARTAVVLHLSMRDFAVAGGIAVAAFGPAAAAPLGCYGVLVMAWGAAIARAAGAARA